MPKSSPSPLSTLDQRRVWQSYRGYSDTFALSEALQKNDAKAIHHYSTIMNINVSDLLSYAIAENNIEIIVTLVKLGADINTTDLDGLTLLHKAAKKDNATIIRMLVKLGAKINAQTNSGYTPIHHAVLEGSLKAIETLAKWGADLNIQGGQENDNITLFHSAMETKKNKRIFVINMLANLKLNINAKDRDGLTPLHWAAINSASEEISVLANLGANAEAQDSFGKTPLHWAQSKEAVCALNALGVNLNVKDNDGGTPLHEAACRANLSSMIALANLNANLDITDNDGLTPLQQLAHYGSDILEDFLTQTNLLDRHDIDEIMGSTQVDTQDLRAQAQNRESAMQRLSITEKDSLRYIKTHYKEQFEQQGQAAIWNNLKQHLEYEYQKNPAQNSNDQDLPLEFDATKEPEPYYKHPAHTAWRYLFQAPNPWMAPGAHWVSRDVRGRLSAGINDKDKQNITSLWLAASDKNITPIDDVSLADRIDFFTNALALLGRSHNWDKDDRNEEYDDMEGDKPSCSMGVSKRLAQSIIGHPIAQKDNDNMLDATILQKIFGEQVVSEDNSDSNNDNAKWTIHSRLQDLDYETLVLLKKALREVILKNATTDQESIFQEYLKVPDDAANQFVSYLERKFGQSKIQGNNKKIKFLTDVFDNYKALAHHMAQHAAEIFCNQILGMMDGLIEEKMPDQDMVDNNNNIVTTPQYNLHSRKRKENERGDNNEEIELLEPEKKRSKVNNNNNI